MRIEDGISFFEKASNEGYLVATYLLGLIYLCSQEASYKEVGFKMIPSTLMKMDLKEIVECRKKIRSNFSGVWIKNKMSLESGFYLCDREQACKLDRNLFEDHECYYEVSDDHRILCDSCKCNRELMFFLSFMY